MQRSQVLSRKYLRYLVWLCRIQLASMKRKVLFRLPFTKEHLKIDRRVFRWQCRRTLWVFKQVIDTDLLDDAVRVHLRRRIVHVKNVRRRELLRIKYAYLFLPLVFLPMIVFYALVRIEFGPINMLEEWVLLGFFFTVCASVFSIPFLFFDSTLRFSWLDLITGLAAVSTAVWVLDFSVLLQVVFVAVVAAVWGGVFVLGWVGITLGIDQIAKKRSLKACPEAHITVALMELVFELQASASDWDSTANRLQITKALDEISMLFRSCARTHRTGDFSIDDQTSLHFQQIANGFRELKLWVLFPRIDTREHLLARLQLYIPSVIVGAWDALPRSDYRERRVSKMGAALAALRHLVIATLPLMVFIGFRTILGNRQWSESFDNFGYLALGWSCIWLIMLLLGSTGLRSEHLQKALEIMASFRK